MPDKDSTQRPPGGLSRRGFLKGVGAGTVASGLLTGAPNEAKTAEAAPDLAGPGEVAVTLDINGKKHNVKVEPRVTLLDCLRNRLDLTGSKKVCDRGTCGACTVLMDDEVVYACSVLAIEAQGHKITTVEGLGGTPEKLTKLQESILDHDGSQCGFCTPGFVVATTAFVKENPNATLEQVRDGLGGNLCRCGTYAGLTEAVLETAKTMKGGA